MITRNPKNTTNDQVEAMLPPDLLYIIVGPTASGKTALAVSLAQKIGGEIISIDSRQVYRGMDIGTGKDLESYGEVPYHLIDICDPKDRYDIFRFQRDFETAFQQIIANGKQAIAVGGTGMYLHSLLIAQPYIQVPVNEELRKMLILVEKERLIQRLQHYDIPADFQIDKSSHKRLIRAIEILEALKAGFVPERRKPHYQTLIVGLDPEISLRREKISSRLRDRIQEGLLDEVKHLLKTGLSHDDLQYYGLEYKYASLHLLGEIDSANFLKKLETEIHRYAKRQMTFFRKMEKDGIKIHWLKSENKTERLQEILSISVTGE